MRPVSQPITSLQGSLTAESLQRWGHSMAQLGSMLFVFGGYGGCGAHKRLDDLIAIDVSTGNAYCHVITGKPAHRVEPPPCLLHWDVYYHPPSFHQTAIVALRACGKVSNPVHQMHDRTACILACVGHILPVCAADSTLLSAMNLEQLVTIHAGVKRPDWAMWRLF